MAGGRFAPGHLGELTQHVPFEMVDEALAATKTTQSRLRDGLEASQATDGGLAETRTQFSRFPRACRVAHPAPGRLGSPARTTPRPVPLGVRDLHHRHLREPAAQPGS
ncbi:transposase domain-containing protein [Amycolatopsis panacis]|uniref:transposase domain-containing protein n=1 Tax=Amycolatopsis panacis TaxID=2340917 RepID=UPI0038992F5A